MELQHGTTHWLYSQRSYGFATDIRQQSEPHIKSKTSRAILIPIHAKCFTHEGQYRGSSQEL